MIKVPLTILETTSWISKLEIKLLSVNESSSLLGKMVKMSRDFFFMSEQRPKFIFQDMHQKHVLVFLNFGRDIINARVIINTL